jgi:hypothetical protein
MPTGMTLAARATIRRRTASETRRRRSRRRRRRRRRRSSRRSCPERVVDVSYVAPQAHFTGSILQV